MSQRYVTRFSSPTHPVKSGFVKNTVTICSLSNLLFITFGDQNQPHAACCKKIAIVLTLIVSTVIGTAATRPFGR